MEPTIGESLPSLIPESKPWISIAKYVFLGVFIAILIPYWSDNHPTQNEALTQATVVSYEATSTVMTGSSIPESPEYSPVVTYQDQTGTVYTKTIQGISERKPFAIGQRVDLYYNKQKPTNAFLADDPYHAWNTSLFRIASIPVFLVALLFALLVLFRKPKKIIDILVLVMPFVVPFAMLFFVFFAMGLRLVDLPQTFSYHSEEQAWSTQSAALTGFMMILVAGISIYVLGWPLAIIRVIVRALKRQSQPQESIEALAAKAVHQDEHSSTNP